MNTELDFENLVEVLEDQEDMVECKECFDLFPKAECAKQDVGYICPTCGKMSRAQSMSPVEYSVFDTYDQEFPDVQEYDPGTTKDYNEEPKIEDALADLIKDEYEAIEGYEVADEKIQKAPISEEEKDDILDTLEHIKEEEEEHIDELKDVCPGCEVPAEDEVKDDKILAEDTAGLSAKIADIDKKIDYYNKQLKLAKDPADIEDFNRKLDGFHKERARLNSLITDGHMKMADLEVEVEDTTLNEAGFLTNLFTRENQTLDSLFVNGYIVEVGEQADEYPTFREAEKAAIQLSKSAGKSQKVSLYGKALGSKELSNWPSTIHKMVGTGDCAIALYTSGKPQLLDKASHLAKQIKAGKKAQDVKNSSATSSTIYKDAYGRKRVTDALNALPIKVSAECEELLNKIFTKGYTVVECSTDAEAPTKTYSKGLASYAQAVDIAKRVAKQESEGGVYVLARIYGLPVTVEDIKHKNAKNILSKLEAIIHRDSSVDIKNKVATAAGMKGGPVHISTIALVDNKPTFIVDDNSNIMELFAKTKTLGTLFDDTLEADEDEAEEAPVADEDETPTETPAEEPAAETPAEEASADSGEAKSAAKDAAGSEEPKSDTEKSKEKNKTYHGHSVSDKAIGNFKKLMYLTGLKVYDAMGKQVPADKTGITQIKPETLLDFEIEVNGERKPLANWIATLAKYNIIAESFAKDLLGSTLTEAYDRVIEDITEDLVTPAEAVAELQDTEKALKSAEQSLQSMKEEYHKYANPAELTAMDNLRVAVDKIVENLVRELGAAGYDDLDYYDSDCYMSGNNSCTITMFLGSEDTFEDGEAEELQDHMTDIIEEALAQIKLPPELVNVRGGALFPDDMIMDEDDVDNGITRGEITVEVTFARNLI